MAVGTPESANAFLENLLDEEEGGGAAEAPATSEGNLNSNLNEEEEGGSKAVVENEKENDMNDGREGNAAAAARKRKRDEEDSTVAVKKDYPGGIPPLHLRPRKLNFWDQRPEAYAGMSADQVKATGMFLLPSHLLTGTGSSRVHANESNNNRLMLGYHPHSAAHIAYMKSGFHTKRLYVSGLVGTQVAEEEIVQWFNDKFEELDMEREGPNPVLSCNIHEKGFAFIELRSSAEATTALSLHETLFMGQPIRVQRPKDYRPGAEDPNYVPGVVSKVVTESESKVFVGGLPLYVTEEQALELLTPFGELKSFNLVRTPEGISKGFAFCEFLNKEVTDAACEGLNGLDMGEKKLIVQRAHTGNTSKLPAIEGALPGAGMGRPILPIEILGANGLKPAEPTVILVLMNMFDNEELEKDDFYNDICLDIEMELERFGTVLDMQIPRPLGRGETGSGKVYARFENIEDCSKAQRALAGRKFNNRTVCTTFFDETKFEAKIF